MLPIRFCCREHEFRSRERDSGNRAKCSRSASIHAYARAGFIFTLCQNEHSWSVRTCRRLYLSDLLLATGKCIRIIHTMNGRELLKKLKKLARLKNEQLQLLKSRGKGSHGTLYFGDKRTILKDLKKEIGKGLLDSMLEDLGIKKDEIEGL